MELRRLPPQRSMLPLLVAALVCAAAATDAPGRGEQCLLLGQGRGSCSGDLTCRMDDENFAICQDPLNEGEACNNVDSDSGWAGCNVGLYCKDNECVVAKEIGDACERKSECGKTGLCQEGPGGKECIAFAGEGENCQFHSDCANGFHCVAVVGRSEDEPGECMPRNGEGVFCSNDVAWFVPCERCLLVFLRAGAMHRDALRRIIGSVSSLVNVRPCLNLLLLSSFVRYSISILYVAIMDFSALDNLARLAPRKASDVNLIGTASAILLVTRLQRSVLGAERHLNRARRGLMVTMPLLGR